MLLEASKRSTMILENPAPEVYLVDLQQGDSDFRITCLCRRNGA